MWSSAGQSEDDDKAANDLIDLAERQIADLTEACEPILNWDGICGLVQVKDEDIVAEMKGPAIKEPPPS